MLKVLIADDEVKVCQLILHLVDWKAIGLEVVGIVNDGRAAYQFICEKKPDIVITDIRMPNYDGIELIKKSKEQFPDIYFIIISGYSQFEYAQNAIKYGVEDYLLKPLKKKELQGTLNKIIEKQNVAAKIESERELLQSMVHNAEEKVKKNLIAEMLINPDRKEQAFTMDSINKEYHCHFTDGFFTVLKIQPFMQYKLINDEVLVLLLSKLDQMVNEKLGPYCEEMATTTSENSIFCIINTKDPALTEMKRQLYKIKSDISSLKDIFQSISIRIGFSCVVENISDLFQCISQAEISIQNRVADPEKYIIEYNLLKSADKVSSDLIDLKLRNNLLSCMERFDIRGVEENIEQLKNLLDEYSYDGRLVYNCYMEVVDIFLFYLKNYNIAMDELTADWFKKRYNMYMTVNDVFKGLQKDLGELFQTFEEQKRLADNKPIRMAKQYINQNYNTALTLESVSAYIGFNPAYFSSLFKKETGKNFMEYVMELRIHNSKQLLIQTTKDIADIAMEVGYTDLKYFSKLFKKISGLNPSEFRRLYS